MADTILITHAGASTAVGARIARRPADTRRTCYMLIDWAFTAVALISARAKVPMKEIRTTEIFVNLIRLFHLRFWIAELSALEPYSV
jgi:hypothetical protein